MRDTSTNKNSQSSLIRVLLRKVQRNNLSDKEIRVLSQLKKEYPHVQIRKKISHAQLNRAVDRNRKAILQKGIGLPSSKERNPIRFNYIMGAVAAVILLFLVFTTYKIAHSPVDTAGQELVLNDHSDQQFITEKSMKKISLADGSTVYMNRNSILSLKKGKFNAYTREVWLEEGEAFFQITRDTSRPFIVHTRNGVSTRVLGTSFNIKSYAELSDQVISVNTGKVQVINARQENIILEPDYKVSISDNDGGFTPGKTDAQSASDWRKGRIVFENASLKEVSFRLRQQYDIELVYDEDGFRNELIYTSFTTETSLQEVLVVLGKLLHADYTVDLPKVYFKKMADQQK